MAETASSTWHWTFERPAHDIWPLLADTVRFNEAAGLPRHTIDEEPQEDGSIRYTGTARVAGFDVRWVEEPANWVSNRWFRHRRVFENGPFKSLCATFRLVERDHGCEGIYTLDVEPANLLGNVIIHAGFLRKSGVLFEKLAGDANEFAAGRGAMPFSFQAPRLGEQARQRIERLVREIEDSDYGHGLAGRLATYVTTSQEVDASRIRPLALARQWGVPERDVVELCLQATLAGLLEVRWDLLCPRCRGAKVVASSLDKLPRGGHCASCNVDYQRDYAKNIELCFRPGEAIREIAVGEFCLFGPMSTPHVKAQITVPAKQSRPVDLDLSPGPIRIRGLDPGPTHDQTFGGGRLPEISFQDDGIVLQEAGEGDTTRLTNKTTRDRTFVIEDRRWSEDALTADKVTVLQSFRDLFSQELLRPGDEVAVQRVTLMFSDLRGSTALYEEVGEAAAYQLVRQHFAFMTRLIRDQDGAVVKTIGDAVMAAFATPAQAAAAALAIQQEIADFNADSGDRALTVKLGIHDGPAIVVTLNGRLDYFGSTVNKAARLQGCSRGGDIVISQTSAGDPDVKRLLVGSRAMVESAELKGFDGPVQFTRIAPHQPLVSANEA